MVTLPIHPRQHAYHAGKSIESALHQLVGRIERALDAKEYTLGVFFDINGAFDNTTMDSIRTVLDDWTVHRSMRNWISYHFNKRLLANCSYKREEDLCQKTQ